MSEIFYLSRKNYEKMREELDELKKIKAQLSEEIGEAARQGDLKENAEYVAAKEKQAETLAKINDLEIRLRNTQITDDLDVDRTEARIGATVTIEDLFRQSYILNRGNVYLTILSIENVLSDATFEAERENTLINQKLVDLYKDSPNKFGDWYHFFGTMLAGYVGEPIDLIVQLYSMYRKISRGEAAEKATLAADKAGADIGSDLRKFMMEDSFNLRRVLAEDLKKKLEKGNKVFSRKIYAEQQDKISVAPKY